MPLSTPDAPKSLVLVPKTSAPVFPHAEARNHAGAFSWEAIDAT